MPKRPKLQANLTDAAVTKLAAPATGRATTYDLRSPGLAVTVSASGAKAWYWIARVGPRVVRRCLGPFPRLSASDARTLAAQLNADAAVGKPIERRRATTGATLGDCYKRFIAAPSRGREKRDRSAATLKHYAFRWRHGLQAYEGRDVRSLTRRDVETIHETVARGHGKSAANRCVGLLGAVLRLAMEDGLLDRLPTVGVRLFAEKARERFLTAEEAARVFAVLETYWHTDASDFVRLALFTGQRYGNVSAIRWSELDLEAGIWSMPRTKTGAHKVPLIGPALDLLRRRQEAAFLAGSTNDLLFPGYSPDRPNSNLDRHWRKIAEKAGCEGVTIHDLRRSLASWQAMTGASLPIVGRTLGHKNPATTAIYARLDHEPVREAMERAVAAMLNKVKTDAITDADQSQ